jgi:hypothetical protein
VSLNLNELFALGLGFDIGGAYYLGRGLLASPKEIVRRSTSFYNVSGPLALSYTEDRADGLIGFGALGLGFFIQIAGYVLAAGGTASGAANASAAVFAISAAFVGAGAVFLAHRYLYRRIIRRTLSDVVMFQPRTGERGEHASWVLVYTIGRELKEPLSALEAGALQGGDGAARYARRVFGVSSVAGDDLDLGLGHSG